MPNMNGLEAGKELRRLYGNSFKLILITGNVLTAEEEQSREIFDKILLKPCSKNDLKLCLDGLK